ncbi:O-antigen ligase family protein [Acinetobacter terrestris]|uniref:Wzy polymerase domain-containing protein n=1 Tax=Acinetobacter terrestris TaxID=2529843 RepID=A0AAW6UVN0_9GAMM|nr:O-antigen ligase family protein [Acinetobacter terrestris]MDK1684501.1 Wzy polymerase domain-containing protein [Acinetobacter terrestris]
MSALFLLLAWLMPNHYSPWLTAHSEIAVFTSFFFLFIGFLLTHKNKKIQVPTFSIFLFILALIPIIQYQIGLIYFFGDAFIVFIYLIVASLLYIISYNKKDNKSFEYLAYIFILGSFFSIYISVLQILQLTNGAVWFVDMRPGGRPYGNFAQPNNYATLICCGIFSLFYLFELKKINIIISGLLFFILVIGVILAQSRTTYLVMLFAFIYLGFFTKKHLNLNIKTLSCIAGTYIFCNFIVIYALDILFSTEKKIRHIGQSTERLALWEQLLYAILDKPWLGYGWNQVSVAQVSVSNIKPVPLYTEHSHNILIDILIWNGMILGSIIIIFILYFIIKKLFLQVDLEKIYGGLIVIAIGVHGLLEFPLDYAFFLFPLIFLLAQIDNSKIIIKLRVEIFYFLLFIYFGGFFKLTKEYFYLESITRQTSLMVARIGNSQFDLDHNKKYFFTQIFGQVEFAHVSENKIYNKNELIDFERIVKRYPTKYNILKYIRILEFNGLNRDAGKYIRLLKDLYDRT